MLEELITFTSTEPYRSRGGMRIKEVLIQLTCINLAQTEGIPLAVFGGSEIRLYDDLHFCYFVLINTPNS